MALQYGRLTRKFKQQSCWTFLLLLTTWKVLRNSHSPITIKMCIVGILSRRCVQRLKNSIVVWRESLIVYMVVLFTTLCFQRNLTDCVPMCSYFSTVKSANICWPLSCSVCNYFKGFLLRNWTKCSPWSVIVITFTYNVGKCPQLLLFCNYSCLWSLVLTETKRAYPKAIFLN